MLPAASPAKPAGRLLTYREAAELLGISERTLYAFVADGHVKPVRLGTKIVRFAPSEIERVQAEGVPS